MEGGESSKMANLNREVVLKNCENVLASGTKPMKIKAILMLADYSKQVQEHVLSSFIPIFTEILADNIANDSVPDLLQEATVYCLKCIACRGDGSLAIEMGEHGVAHSLIRLLPRAEGKMQKVLLECLLVVVSFCDTSRTVVAANGGLEIIIGWLNTCDTDVRLYSLEILSALALQREVRMELIRLGALCFIVEAAGVGSMISRERACRSIGLLGISRQARCTLVELGVIQVLVELFRVGDNTAKLVAGNTLGVVVSSHVDYIRHAAEAGAIPLYAELLQGSDDSGKEIAKEVFYILGVVEANAVEIVGHLVTILIEGDDEVKLAAAHVIWDMLDYKHTTSVLRDSGVILILVEILGHGSDDEVKEIVSGAFVRISYDEGGRMTLADAGAIPILVELLDHAMEELRNKVAEALSNFHEDPLYRDRLSDVVNDPSFRYMQNRLIRIRASNGHMIRSLRGRSVEQLIWILDYV